MPYITLAPACSLNAWVRGRLTCVHNTYAHTPRMLRTPTVIGVLMQALWALAYLVCPSMVHSSRRAAPLPPAWCAAAGGLHHYPQHDAQQQVGCTITSRLAWRGQ